MEELRLKGRIAALYEGKSEAAERFRYALLMADIATVLFLVVVTYYHGEPWLRWADMLFGIYLALDYLARLWIAPKKGAFVINLLNLADLVAMISLIIPVVGGALTFLRSLRILRVLRTYRVQQTLREDFPVFKRHEDVILSAVNLVIFVFIMTEIVFVTQVTINPEVENFLDAMYFTITTLTTTGFGDITLQGEHGRLISILIMVFGVSLFLRLIQTIFRPSKVRYTCKDCGLFLHESDAVHCKHCGAVLNIPSDGHV
jgi:voltage-gated potassium channel